MTRPKSSLLMSQSYNMKKQGLPGVIGCPKPYIKNDSIGHMLDVDTEEVMWWNDIVKAVLSHPDL